MHKSILFAICYLTVCLCLAQKITVMSEESGLPVEGAVVEAENPSVFLVSNFDGVVTHRSFVGEKTVTIRALGFETTTVLLDFNSIANHEVALSTTLFNLDQVIITASRWSQRVDNVPMKVITVDPSLVEFQNPQTAADLLGTSGKVFIQKSQQGGGSPMIRGFATNRLIYSVDGVRMNTAIFRGGNIQNVINLDPFSIQNTEIMFGPGSVFYGSDAIGGVMSFQTKAPSFSDSDQWKSNINLTSRFSSANREKTGHLDVSIANQKWAFLTSVTHWDFDHLRQGRNGPEEFLKTSHVKPGPEGQDEVRVQDDPVLQRPSAYDQTNFMQKASYQFNPNLSLHYGFHFSETSSYGRYDRHNRMRNGLPQSAVWDYGPQRWKMNLLRLEHTKSNSWYQNASIRFARQDFAESRITRPFNSPFETTREEAVTAYSVNADFLKKWNGRFTLNYGLEYVHNDVLSSGKIEDISTGELTRGASRYPNASWQSMGVYASGNKELADQWTLNSGLRVNAFLIDAVFDTSFYPIPFNSTSLSDASLTGSLGTVYRPTDNWIININAGTAFRAPNVDDLGKVFDSEPGAVTVPNTQLDSEYAYNLDIGTSLILFENLKLDFTGYYTWLDNVMVRRDFLLDGADSIVYDGQLSKVQAIQNLSSATIYGIQIGLELKTKTGWALQSDLNLQNGEEESENGLRSPVRHVAPLFGVSRIQYRESNWQVELNAQYQGTLLADELSLDERSKTEIYALDASGRAFAAGWYTLNFKSSWQIKKWLTANVGVENITDRRYRPYSSGISGPGRNYVISVSMRF